MQHLHTEYERELVPLFFKVLVYASGSELDEDAVKYNEIVPAELISQLDQQGELLGAKSRTARIKPIRDFDTTITSPYCLNGVRTHEQFDVAVNCSRGHVQFAGQVFTGIVPVSKQLGQQMLTAFVCAHAFTPLLLLPTTNLKGIT